MALAALAALLVPAAGCASPGDQQPSTGASPGGPAASGPGGPGGPADAGGPPGPLTVSGRNLLSSDGRPFVWVGDTAWNITGLDRAGIDTYLDRRSAQGFMVIQAVAAFREPAQAEDAYGNEPFDGDAARPRTTPGSDPADPEQYDYWDHVDHLVAGAHRRGLTVALFPVWSFHLADKTLTAANAHAYGEFLGKRYGGDGVTYVLGGDDPNPRPHIWPELRAGLTAGVAAPIPSTEASGERRAGVRTSTNPALVTYHPAGYKKPSYGYQDTDYAMVQSGHCVKNGWQQLLSEAYREVSKPIIDSEPLYEGHPRCWKLEEGYATTEEVRRQLYWSLFSGGFGVTYGHHSVWQTHGADGARVYAHPRNSWQEALGDPMAEQVRHLAGFLRLRPIDDRVPDDGLVRADLGEQWSRKAGLRDGQGRWAMVYLPTGGTVQIETGKLAGERVRVSWYDPRTGALTARGERATADAAELTPPERQVDAPGDSQDWILILDRL